MQMPRRAISWNMDAMDIFRQEGDGYTRFHHHFPQQAQIGAIRLAEIVTAFIDTVKLPAFHRHNGRPDGMIMRQRVFIGQQDIEIECDLVIAVAIVKTVARGGFFPFYRQGELPYAEKLLLPGQLRQTQGHLFQ